MIGIITFHDHSVQGTRKTMFDRITFMAEGDS